MEIQNTFAEGLALLHILRSDSQRSLDGGTGTRCDNQSLLGKLFHQLNEALAFHVAQEILTGNKYVIKKYFRCVLRLQAEFLQISAAAKTPFAFDRFCLYHDQRDALCRFGGISFYHYTDQVGSLAVGQKCFVTVKHIIPAFFDRGRSHRLQIGTGARLGHGNRRNDFSRRHLWQPFLFLLFATIGIYIVGHDAGMYAVAEAGDVGVAQLFHQHHLVFEVATAAAILGRDRYT